MDLHIDTDVSEERSASIFSLEDRSVVVSCAFGICLQVHTTLQPSRAASTVLSEV